MDKRFRPHTPLIVAVLTIAGLTATTIPACHASSIDRVVDQLLCKLALVEHQFDESGALETLMWAEGLPLNRKLALAYAKSVDYGRFVKDADFRSQLAGKLQFEMRSTRLRIESPSNIDSFVAFEARRATVLYPDKQAHELRNRRELEMNASVTGELAAKVAAVEHLLEEMSGSELKELRKNARTAISEALKRNREAAASLSRASDVADSTVIKELRESRERVASAISAARE